MTADLNVAALFTTIAHIPIYWSQRDNDFVEPHEFAGRHWWVMEEPVFKRPNSICYVRAILAEATVAF